VFKGRVDASHFISMYYGGSEILEKIKSKMKGQGQGQKGGRGIHDGSPSSSM